ncbi:uncharacterized protein BJ171DRAFT_292333 [Polychytrium aggregatum]|uniref:uncharacterized protein n=1 Tax=Polychytrium aggregatum TaxID=110093 RepID=UPI0022FDE688|nr:uncharacterized protein BJ171DRAFT_292333 [Polychytrium aggregatum]KAI9207152.1 hypothetical protein BJ171DRAFT_292333 [Polychytrium aggregatum]
MDGARGARVLPMPVSIACAGPGPKHVLARRGCATAAVASVLTAGAAVGGRGGCGLQIGQWAERHHRQAGSRESGRSAGCMDIATDDIAVGEQISARPAVLMGGANVPHQQTPSHRQIHRIGRVDRIALRERMDGRTDRRVGTLCAHPLKSTTGILGCRLQAHCW